MKKKSDYQLKGPGYRYSDLHKQCTEYVRSHGGPSPELQAAHRARMEAEAPLDNRTYAREDTDGRAC